MIAASSGSGGGSLDAARPLGAKLAGERLAFHVPLSREGEDAPGLGAGHLGREVGRRPEPVDAEALGVTCSDEATIADETGAEERGGMRVVVGRWKGEAEPRVGHGVLGIAAVDVVAGESRAVTEVLSSGRAVDAFTAGPAEPWHADALPVCRA